MKTRTANRNLAFLLICAIAACTLACVLALSTGTAAASADDSTSDAALDASGMLMAGELDVPGDGSSLSAQEDIPGWDHVGEEFTYGDWEYTYYGEHDDEGNAVSRVYIWGYKGTSKSITIPSVIDGKQVYGIAAKSTGSPESWPVTSITVGKGIKRISGFAFESCTDLQSITFERGSQLFEIGNYAFYNCSSLTSFVCPEHLKTFEKSAFDYCTSLERLQFNDELEAFNKSSSYITPSGSYWVNEWWNPLPGAIGDTVSLVVSPSSKNFMMRGNMLYSKDGKVLYGYYGPLDTSFVIPAGTEVIANNAFIGKDMTGVTLNSGLKHIGEYAFYATKIESLVVPDSVEVMRAGAFRECRNLKSVVLGKGLGDLSANAGTHQFFNCTSLETVIIPEGVTGLGMSAFAQCALKSIHLPKSMTHLDYGAFGNNYDLAEVTGGEGLVKIMEYVFQRAAFTSFPFQNMDHLKFVSGRAFNNCMNYLSPDYPSYLTRNADGNYTRPDDYFVVTGTSDYDAASQVLALVNEERVRKGVSRLAMDAEMQQAAMQRAAEIALLFDHTRPNGESFRGVLDSASGENIVAGAWGQNSTAAQAVSSWKGSSTHYSSMVNAGFASTGIGCFRLGSITYWVQLFGTSSAAGSAGAGSTTKSYTVPIDYDTLNMTGSGFNLNMATSDPQALAQGDGYQLDYGVMNYGWGYNTRIYMPLDAATFTWSSSDPFVATVSSKGLVRAGSRAGLTTITATTRGGRMFTFNVRVKPAWTRVAGSSRYKTMQAIVKRAFPQTSDVAVLVSGADKNFPDALSAAALAGAYECPIITTDSSALSDQARSELERLQVDHVVIVGGNKAVAPAVEQAVRALGGISEVERIAGSTRYATSSAVMARVLELGGGSANTVFIATGENFPDALSAGAWSYAHQSPIVLVNPKKGLSDEQASAIRAAGVGEVVILGGTLAVPETVGEKLAGLNVERISGANRYDTSKQLAEWSVRHGASLANPVVATGKSPADALAGAPLAGKSNSVLLMADQLVNGKPKGGELAVSFLSSSKSALDHGYFLGGPKAVTESLANAIVNAT